MCKGHPHRNAVAKSLRFKHCGYAKQWGAGRIWTDVKIDASGTVVVTRDDKAAITTHFPDYRERLKLLRIGAAIFANEIRSRA